MVRRAAKGKTPMLAPGSRSGARWPGRWRGFTLLELMLVVALVAFVGAGVGFALRDTGTNLLERDAQRVAAVLEVARAQSRASGSPVYWRPGEAGFDIIAGKTVHSKWLVEGTVVEGPQLVVLGPEPIIERHTIVLSVPGSRVRISTDGLRPFEVQGEPGPVGPASGS